MLEMATTHHVPIYRWLYIVVRLTQLDCQYRMLPAYVIHSTESCLLAALATFIWWSNFQFSLLCLTWFFFLHSLSLGLFFYSSKQQISFRDFCKWHKTENRCCKHLLRKKKKEARIESNSNEQKMNLTIFTYAIQFFPKLKQLNGYVQMETCNVYTEKRNQEKELKLIHTKCAACYDFNMNSLNDFVNRRSMVSQHSQSFFFLVYCMCLDLKAKISRVCVYYMCGVLVISESHSRSKISCSHILC